jgi:hypothetical protein
VDRGATRGGEFHRREGGGSHRRSHYEWKTWSDYQPPDERDGAGKPNAARISYLTEQSLVENYYWRQTDFDPEHKLTAFCIAGVPEGMTIRAVLVWAPCPGQGVKRDLDLHLLNPNGVNIRNAASYDSAWEIVHAVAPVTGDYCFEVQHFSWEDCDGYVDGVYAALAVDVR